MKKDNFYVRNSAVLSKNENTKIWRETLVSLNANCTLLTSDFCHYKKQKRNNVNIVKTILLKTPGYKSNISINRIIDAHVFGIKSLFYLIKRLKNIGNIYIAYPTPETLFYLSFIKYLNKDITLVVDVRDAWPRALNIKRKKLYKLFSYYLNFLTKFTQLKNISDVIYMSKNLSNYYSNVFNKDVLNHHIVPNPLIEYEKFSSEFICINKKITFFGTLNDQFSFEPLFYLLNKNYFKSWQINIYGDGYSKLSLIKKFSKYSNVNFKGFVDFDKIKEISLNDTDAFFCFFENPFNYENHFSNKIVEYMSFNKPIITNFNNNTFDYFNSSIEIGINYKNNVFKSEEDLIMYFLSFNNQNDLKSSFKLFFENYI